MKKTKVRHHLRRTRKKVVGVRHHNRFLRKNRGASTRPSARPGLSKVKAPKGIRVVTSRAKLTTPESLKAELLKRERIISASPKRRGEAIESTQITQLKELLDESPQLRAGIPYLKSHRQEAIKELGIRKEPGQYFYIPRKLETKEEIKPSISREEAAEMDRRAKEIERRRREEKDIPEYHIRPEVRYTIIDEEDKKPESTIPEPTPESKEERSARLAKLREYRRHGEERRQIFKAEKERYRDFEKNLDEEIARLRKETGFYQRSEDLMKGKKRFNFFDIFRPY